MSIIKTNLFPAVISAGIVCGSLWAGEGLNVEFAHPYDEALEYIESDGTAYFDTGLKLTPETKVEIEFEPLNDYTDATGIFGARGGASDHNYSVFVDFSGITVDINNGSFADYRYIAKNSGKQNSVVGTLSASEIFFCSRYTKTIFDQKGQGWTGDPFETPSTAHIFAINGTSWPKCAMRLYGLKIWQGGMLVRNYRPCRFNGEATLCDLCNRQFPPILGGGSFKPGAIISPPSEDVTLVSTQTNAVLAANMVSLGEGAAAASVTPVWRFAKTVVTPLPYLDGDGRCINTGLKLNSDMFIEMEYALLRPVENITGIFGARTGASKLNISIFADPERTALDFVEGGFRRAECTNEPPKINCRYRAFLSREPLMLFENGQCVANNTQSFKRDYFETASTAKIFNVAGTEWENGQFRLYSLKIMQGHVLIRDYVPAQTEGLRGLYDRVEGLFSPYAEVAESSTAVESPPVEEAPYLEGDGGAPSKAWLNL